MRRLCFGSFVFILPFRWHQLTFLPLDGSSHLFLLLLLLLNVRMCQGDVNFKIIEYSAFYFSIKFCLPVCLTASLCMSLSRASSPQCFTLSLLLSFTLSLLLSFSPSLPVYAILSISVSLSLSLSLSPSLPNRLSLSPVSTNAIKSKIFPIVLTETYF